MAYVTKGEGLGAISLPGCLVVKETNRNPSESNPLVLKHAGVAPKLSRFQGCCSSGGRTLLA